jgi:hypothetical protein
MPAETLAKWAELRDALRATHANTVARDDDRARWAKMDQFLDASHGACWLRDSAVAAVVAHALKHFDGTRYRLLAWIIMPNHVHAVLQPHAGNEL